MAIASLIESAHRTLARVERALQSRWGGCALLVIVVALYTAAYTHHNLNPGAAPIVDRGGWWGWADQYHYAQAAAELTTGQITAEAYHYPLGYSALVALMRPIAGSLNGAFLLVNLGCILGTALACWRLARRWLSATVTTCAIGLFLFTHAPLLNLTWIVPWNTLPTQCALCLGLMLYTEQRGPAAVWGLAGLAAFCWGTRSVEAVTLAPLLVVAVVRLPSWRARITHGLFGLGLIAAAIVSIAVLNQHVFGDWRTPYEHASAAVGFFAYPLLPKLYWLFIDGHPFFGEIDTALLWRFPWLALIPAGLVFWVRREGWTAVAVVAAFGLNLLCYVGYNDFFPSGLFRYSLIHYLVWMTLPLFLANIAALRHLVAMPALRPVLVACIGAVVLLSGVQLRLVPLEVPTAAGTVLVLPATRPIWVDFPAVSLDARDDLRLDGRPLVENPDYQIPYTPSGLQLLLSRRTSGGTALTFATDPASRPVPVVGRFGWGWAWVPARWWRLCGVKPPHSTSPI